MKTFLKTGVLLVSLGALASSPDPAFYQYWFDDDVSTRQGNTNVFDHGTNILNINASRLKEGRHAVNYRLADKDKKWGHVETQYFIVPVSLKREEPKEAIAPVLMQYWFDDDVASRETNTQVFEADGKSLQVNVAGLSEGVHTLNYRLANVHQQWGHVITQYFVVPVTLQKKDPIAAVEPVLMQYWFDNEEASRARNTRVYNSQTNSLVEDAGGLSGGGHTVFYRLANNDNQWGNVTKQYVSVPVAPDNSSGKPVAYRVLMNNAVISTGIFSNGSDITIKEDISDVPVLNNVESRTFTYKTGEKTVSMNVTGTFPVAVQMLSESNEWGVPMVSDYSHSVTTELKVDSVAVPSDYTFAKVDNNGFKAYRFMCRNASVLYIKASQDCGMDLYYVDPSADSNLSYLNRFTLKKGETTRFENANLNNKQLVAVLYDTGYKEGNQDDEVFLRIMYEDNRLPKPVISFDNNTWEVTISCADERARIYYTLDGSEPTHDGSNPTGNTLEYTPGHPIKVEESTRVKAIAVYGDLADSEVENKLLDDKSICLPTPQLVFFGGEDLNEFILTNSVEDVTTYYVLGNDDSSDNILYDAELRETFDADKPILIDDGVLLRAFSVKPGVGDSEMLKKRVNHNEYVTPAPRLRYSEGYVVAEIDGEDTEVRFEDETGEALQSDAGDRTRVKVDYNSIVDAYALRKGLVESKRSRLTHTDVPVIKLDLFTVTIEKKDGQVVRYTTDGNTPDESSTLYEKPFVVDESCTVRAVAFEGDLIPAEGDSRTVSYNKCQRPKMEYDGRFLALTAEPESTIRYIMGNSDKDVHEGDVYEGKIDLGGLRRVVAVAMRDGWDDSDTLTFDPPYYSNDKEAFTLQPGDLKDAFGWCDDLAQIESLTVHGTLNGNSNADSGDYKFISSMPRLLHLDLADVVDTMVPDSAFVGSGLVSVTFPTNLEKVGRGIFGKENSTLCAVQLPSEEYAPAHLLEGVTNTNLLVYAKNRSRVSDMLKVCEGAISNVVIYDDSRGNDTADEVTLSHGLPFFVPSRFTARQISFTRAFTKETLVNTTGNEVVPSGWETLVVPFNVQSISSGGRIFRPFGEADMSKGECPFWLFTPENAKWVEDKSMAANTPYLLAFPNNPFYEDEFCVNGDVVFSSTNVDVVPTPEIQDMTCAFGVSRNIVGNYRRVRKEEGVLAINDTPVSNDGRDYVPGGIFVMGHKDAMPFECYVVTESGVRAIPVFDRSEVEDLIGDYGTRIWSEYRSICINSSMAMKLRICDMVGNLVRIVDVKVGETVRVDDITPGIYFVGNKKILVKG